MISIQHDGNDSQESPTIVVLPIVESTTDSSLDDQAEQQPSQTNDSQGERPNKYHYPEFNGLAGERYLLSLAQQFAPFALWRTWYAAVSYQAPGNTCHVGVSRLTDPRKRLNGISVGVKERKLYLDLQALEARGWLEMRRVYKTYLNEDGTLSHGFETVKDFTGFYKTAHEYHLWLECSDYIPPERENVPLILEDAELCKRLIKFENYRRLLLCRKPGRKPNEETDDFQSAQLRKLEEIRTPAPKVKEYLNTPDNILSPYRKPLTPEFQCGELSSSSTSEKGTGETSTTIRRVETGSMPKPEEDGDRQTEQLHSNPKPNPLPRENEQSGGAAENVFALLGYTEQELKRDPKKRGAAAAGIPADQYGKLKGGQDRAEQEESRQRELEVQEVAGPQQRPERERPARVVTEVETYVRQYDNPELIQSDITRALKLYFTAQQALECFNDHLFWAFYDEARKAASKYARKHKNRRGYTNRVPYMFTCWENAFNFSLEELVFLRTEDPLYTDYSLWEVTDHLRASYQQKWNEAETRLDYREWLQTVLDQLEQRQEPKKRSNRTSREH